MTYDIITLGGLIQDIIFLIKKEDGLVLANKKDPLRQKLLAFEQGAKIYIERAFIGSGGGAANAAVSFASLGLKTAVISCVGEDTRGQELIDSSKKKGVETRFIQKTKKEMTGFSLICSLKDKGMTIFSLRGADRNLKVSSLQGIKTKWFYITSLTTPHWPKILEKISKIQSKVAFNPGQIQLKNIVSLKKFLKKAEVLILNKDEALELILKLEKRKKVLSLKELSRKIWFLGPKMVAITDGKRGAAAFDGKSYYFQKALKVKAVDTTGAGDAFGSAFVASLFYWPNNLKRALSWGIKNSSSVIQKFGAQAGLLKKRNI